MRRLLCWLMLLMAVTIPCAVGESAVVCVTSSQYPELRGCPDVPIYEAPTDGSKRLGGVFSGTELVVTDQGSGWTQVVIGTITGWIPSSCVAAVDTSAAVQTEMAAVVPFGGEEGVALYARPDRSSEEISRIHAESTVTLSVMLAGGAWLQAVSPTGESGWLEAAQAAQIGSGSHAVILNDAPEHRLHLRASPSTKAESLGKYYSGLALRLLYAEEDNDQWQRVSAAGVSGWMKKEFLVSADESPCGYLPPIGHVVGAAAEGVKLRAAPQDKAAALQAYPNGTAVEVLAVVGRWAQVRLRDGWAGYVPLANLNGEPKAATADGFALEAEAEADEGTLLSAGTVVQVRERPRMGWYQQEDQAEGSGGVTWCEPGRIPVYTAEGSQPVASVEVSRLALDW